MTRIKIILLTLIYSITLLSAQVKIACVGDSITFGSGIKQRETLSYPSQLRSMLGKNYEVKNFGVSGCTMLQKGDRPYMKTTTYKASLEYQPDIVIIKLGTNDSKPRNWKHKTSFPSSANKLITSYQQLNSKPRIILCKPVPVIGSGRWGITEKILRNDVAKQIAKVASSMNIELINLHIPLRDKPELIPDTVHPNAEGAKLIAQHLNQYLSQPRDKSFKFVTSNNSSESYFHGFKMLSWNKNKHRIVIPKLAAQGKPWIWRARFWGHQPQFDIQMLELGYHILYCDVANLFGAPSAVKRWDNFYQITQQKGLNPKPILEGMSRGGLIIHNWAVANPDKVAGIIGDNCVMDFKSWPAGMGAANTSTRAWNNCKSAYNFKTDAQAKTYKLNPIDTLNKIKQANIPLLYLIGLNDKVVPASENASLAEEKLKPYQHLTIINKPGKGHHPHSLPNPAPITKFALKCSGFLNAPLPTK